jgi:hypothetical protein
VTAQRASRHEWRQVTHRNAADAYRIGEQRRCRNCGVLQTREAEQEWMRVVARRWVPLVGRCKGYPAGIVRGSVEIDISPSSHQEVKK